MSFALKCSFRPAALAAPRTMLRAPMAPRVAPRQLQTRTYSSSGFFPWSERSDEQKQREMDRPPTKEEVKEVLQEQAQTSDAPTPEKPVNVSDEEHHSMIQDAMGALTKMGVAPDGLLKHVVQDNELIQLFQKPHVHDIIEDVMHNPTNIVKYALDKDMRAILGKIGTLATLATGAINIGKGIASIGSKHVEETSKA